MATNVRAFLIAAMLAIPSALCLRIQSDVPKFCEDHDDCLYFVSAKSLADGDGCRIASLPGEPAQTKYPPLYPLLLSVAWHFNPEFPANLTLAVWISWTALPAMLILLSAYLPRIGFTGRRMRILLTLIAINPYTVTFSARLLSELTFVVFVLGTLLLADWADRGNSRIYALGAGIAMGLGYLVRSAGIVGLAALPLYFLIRRKPALAAATAAGMAPFVAGWMGWVSLHQVQTSDLTLMYYVDYAGYERVNVTLELLPILLWKNIDGVLWSLGSLLIPRIFDSLFIKILAQVIGVAMIAGVLRMVRQGKGLPYALFAGGSILLLIVWHFPPSERFVYPLFPLALMGFFTEIEHLADMIRQTFRHRDRSQRAAARLLAGVVGVLAIGSLALQLYMITVFIPEDVRVFRERHRFEAGVFAWFRNHTPPSAAVLTPRDPLFYLSTGRHATSRPVPPMHWYRDDLENLEDYPRTIGQFAREHNIGYVYYNGIDYGWTHVEAKFEPIIRSNRELEVAFTEKTATVYRVLSPGVLAISPDRTPDNRVNDSPREHDH